MARFGTFRLLFLIALLLTPRLSLAQPAQHQAVLEDLTPYFKQLSGPPAEFGDMAPADPLEAARHSKSALLPVTLADDGTGRWSWETQIPVEGESWRFAVLPGSSSTAVESWELTVRGPIGDGAHPAQARQAKITATDFGPLGRAVPARHYELDGLPPGDYTLAIQSDDPGEGYLLVEGAGSLRLLSHLAAFDQLVGQRIFLVATTYDRDLGADELGVGTVSEAFLRVRTPDREVLVSPLYDDGRHRDGEAGDGVYGGSFLASSAGNFNAQVVFRGRTGANGGFVRTAEHLIPILEDDTHLVGEAAASSLRSARRLGIRIDLSAPEAAGHYRAYAEVWGTDPVSYQLSTPVAWVGGMAGVQSGAVELGLDTRWIDLSGAQAPFELRNVRIEDPDYLITLTSAERMSLVLPTLPQSSVPGGQIVVDEEMLAGPRPDLLDPAEPGGGGVDCAEDHRLLLVHGYCSSDVWSSQLDHFPNAEVFLDLEQNISHDEFAQRILAFALDNDWRSYGIVAHSQGGMASLHLYNYYWSGLDNAGEGRLIQSVGTPYKGTPLAGMLAELGEIFDKGCGTNYGLTPDGAVQWLDGIAAASKQEVSYYTTSFEDNWWYDYCHLLTDLFLDDPDDGVVEWLRGQLPDGDNRGHKEGWCHTSDMRDPPQTSDGSRNDEMNANAAAPPEGPPCRGLSGPPKP